MRFFFRNGKMNVKVYEKNDTERIQRPDYSDSNDSYPSYESQATMSNSAIRNVLHFRFMFNFVNILKSSSFF